MPVTAHRRTMGAAGTAASRELALRNRTCTARRRKPRGPVLHRVLHRVLDGARGENRDQRHTETLFHAHPEKISRSRAGHPLGGSSARTALGIPCSAKTTGAAAKDNPRSTARALGKSDLARRELVTHENRENDRGHARHTRTRPAMSVVRFADEHRSTSPHRELVHLQSRGTRPGRPSRWSYPPITTSW